MNIFKKLQSIYLAKHEHFIYLTTTEYHLFGLLFKIAILLNSKYKYVKIFRYTPSTLKIKMPKKVVVIGLRYYGKNVNRRTNGYAKQFIIDNPGTRCIFSDVKLTSKNATVDHIVPISKGGNNTKVNLIVCSKKCNAERGNQKFYKYLRYKNKKYRFKIRKPYL